MDIGNTIIFGDLHLGHGHPSAACANLKRALDDEPNAKTLILAGDTFELIFPHQHIGGLQNSTELMLMAILKSHADFFSFLNKSEIQKVIFIKGEHDYSLSDHASVLQEALPEKEVHVTDHYYDAATRTLVIHGHEFDYNRVFDKQGTSVNLIDGLTIAITNFIDSITDSNLVLEMNEMNRRGVFSHFYSTRQLPHYVEAAETLFGADRKTYEQAIAEHLRSPQVKQWIGLHYDWVVHALGIGVRTAALSPPSLLKLYRPFSWILDRIYERKVYSVLAGRSYPDAPEYLFGNNRGPVHKLICSHLHVAKEESWQIVNGNTPPRIASFVNLAPAIAHAIGFQNDHIYSWKQFQFAKINHNVDEVSVKGTLPKIHAEPLNAWPYTREHVTKRLNSGPSTPPRTPQSPSLIHPFSGCGQ